MEEQKDFEEISVAICDDSALMRNLVSRIVSENPNFKIVCKAVNGKMLLDMLPSCKPDVIVLDIEMPVMTGVAAPGRGPEWVLRWRPCNVP